MPLPWASPTTNAVIETVGLPVDVNVPVILDDTVYFPPKIGSSQPVPLWVVNDATSTLQRFDRPT